MYTKRSQPHVIYVNHMWYELNPIYFNLIFIKLISDIEDSNGSPSFNIHGPGLARSMCLACTKTLRWCRKKVVSERPHKCACMRALWARNANISSYWRKCIFLIPLFIFPSIAQACVLLLNLFAHTYICMEWWTVVYMYGMVNGSIYVWNGER